MKNKPALGNKVREINAEWFNKGETITVTKYCKGRGYVGCTGTSGYKCLISHDNLQYATLPNQLIKEKKDV